MAADYEVTLSLTDSESFRFTVPLVDVDGDPLPLDGLAFEYVLDGCGCGGDLRLDETDGISVDLDTSIVTIAPDPERRLRCGTYQHGFRSTDANNVTIQHFDGEVSVTKGGF